MAKLRSWCSAQCPAQCSTCCVQLGDRDAVLTCWCRMVSDYLGCWLQGFYFTGDGCRRDAKGHLTITGRVDDVINVSGHRVGTAEVESALTEHDSCAEAAVIG